MRALKYALLGATAVVGVLAAFRALTQEAVVVWDHAAQQAFYMQDQGSRVMPMSWAQALKQPDGTPFLAGSLQRYGYLANPATPTLPVGVMQATQDGTPWLSMTCAACHTRDITFGGKSFRIDGGPAFADFQTFATDLDAAVAAVLPGKPGFAAFADSVRETGDTEPGLESRLTGWHKAYDQWVKSMPTGANQHWGPARMDAIGMIFNRVVGLDIGTSPDHLISGNMVTADAPVRYPFLWNSWRQDFTQWARFAPNGDDLGALMRNLGQVYGVFAQFTPQLGPDGGMDYLTGNSVNFDGLWDVERLVRAIPAPSYEAVFPGRIDANLAAVGQTIYTAGCAGCHSTSKSDLPRLRPAWATGPKPLDPVGTDTRQLDYLNRPAQSGTMEGASILPWLKRLGLPLPDDLSIFEPLNKTDPALKIVTVAVAGSIIEKSLHGLISPTPATTELLAEIAAEPIKAARNFYDIAIAWSQPKRVYEARALQGIWAAAPYLHNGSVPTLADLLEPPSMRPPAFAVGPAYDPDKIGLHRDQAPSAFKMVTTGCEDIASGYSRCGHDYGTSLNPDDKKALLEYLKQL